ncbi:hypothetical protein RclHR1_10070008 [Rhizophagus clarus]|uniref:Uncharacterized protein n=1 Tax=Rhizophagus clarus TaxID=94130 RepID=A0A2Z6QSR0_9GLOM|nr:hypothetical protein RclHR1_10070008 [Rhizophagus clarus]
MMLSWHLFQNAKKEGIYNYAYITKPTKRNQICGSSVIDDDIGESTPLCIYSDDESESNSSGSLLEATKLEIYNNLPKCEYHIQECLIAEDERHLKLNNDMITICVAKFVGVDVTNSPPTKIFDKINYCYPDSKKPLEVHNDNVPNDANSIII